MYDIETGFYNKDQKQSFINDWCESDTSRDLYSKVLKYAGKLEKDLNKDIYELNNFEFADLLRSYRATTIKSLNTTLTVLRRYVEWAMSEGFLDGRIPVTAYFKKDDLIKYINKANKFVSREELFDSVLENARNDQDAVILALLYDGIKGTNNCELINLKIKDVDFENNLIYVKDEAGNVIRENKISKRTKELIQDAIDQVFYEKSIDVTAEPKAKAYKLPQNDYVIRQAVRNEGKQRKEGETSYKGYNGSEPVSWQIINTRVKKVAKESDRLYITTVTIFQSGMLNKLREIEEQNGELTTENYKNVWKEHGGNEESYFNLKELYLTSYKPMLEDDKK